MAVPSPMTTAAAPMPATFISTPMPAAPETRSVRRRIEVAAVAGVGIGEPRPAQDAPLRRFGDLAGQYQLAHGAPQQPGVIGLLDGDEIEPEESQAGRIRAFGADIGAGGRARQLLSAQGRNRGHGGESDEDGGGNARAGARDCEVGGEDAAHSGLRWV